MGKRQQRRSVRFGPDDIADLTGKTAVVTGANSGIGFETALELAAHGAHVVLACRNGVKAEEAGDRIVGAAPEASVETLDVDLASLASVREAAAKLTARHARIDVLVNNAGIMGSPYLLSEDGFEYQVATNHLGPFAFTGLVLPTLLTTMGSRVVTVSSTVHRFGALDPARLVQPSPERNRWLVYSDTKLTNLAFTHALDSRLKEAGEGSRAYSAHPGWARTELTAKGPSLGASRARARFGRFTSQLGQSPATGALPSLYAAASPDAVAGRFYGPRHAAGMFGPPVEVAIHHHRAVKRRADAMWEISEELTGIRYPFEKPPVSGRLRDGGGKSPSPDS